jgi:hypothetical protein
VLSHKITHEELDAVFYEVELPLIEALAAGNAAVLRGRKD